MTKQKVQGGHPNIGQTMGEGEKQKRKKTIIITAELCSSGQILPLLLIW